MRLVRLLLYVLVVLSASICSRPSSTPYRWSAARSTTRMEVKFDRPDPSIVADYRNGLTPAQGKSYYHLSQGSEILPWILLTAVDVADPGSSKPFVENLSRYGLLPDPGRDDGLPVGLTVASNPFTFGMDFVGVNCAACHVGELRHDGKAVRVDGAPNMFNLQLFYSDAVDALVATTSDRGKLWEASSAWGGRITERYGVAAPFVRPATLVYYGANVLLHRDRLDARLELIDVIDVAKEQRDPAAPDLRLRPPRCVRRHPQLPVHPAAQGGRGRSFRGQHGEPGQARRGGEVPAALVAQGHAAGAGRGLSRPARTLSRASGASRITTGSNGPSTPIR